MRVLVTGEKSYAGTQFANRMYELNKEWKIDFISVRDSTWKDKDFNNYEAIYHVAGIVHQKETTDNKDLYYKVNRDLTYQLALKAKEEGVKSFVFLSTMAIYGLIGRIGRETIITKDTIPSPTSHYGKSNLEAEELLETLQSPNFKISILRIPMIYGPNCPGNYKSLSKIIKRIPVFPEIKNRRSMIFIDHLSDIVAYIIEKKLTGIFLIKNPDDVETLEMVQEIRKFHGKKTFKSRLFGVFIKRFGNSFNISRKIFGTVYYKSTESNINGFNYTNMEFKKTISLTEQANNYDSTKF